MNDSARSRREFIRAAGFGTAAIVVSGWSLGLKEGERRPNFLFIMTDDHGYQAISCYGSRINKTPNIDRLAQDGVRFTRAFCTNSICAPSRAVMLTGKYSHLNGVLDNGIIFDGSQLTFPKLLRQAGYQTALFGKWHLKSDPTGFDYWNILPGQGQYYNPDFIEMGFPTRRRGYATNLITDDCLDWLRTRDAKRPFAVLLHHKAPHRNWMPDARHLSMYENTDVPLPETFFDDYATRSDAARLQTMRIADVLRLATDLKVKPGSKPGYESPGEKADRDAWNAVYARFDEEQRKAWDEAYGASNESFLKADLKGDALAKWKYERYIKDYLRCIASVDDNVGRVLDYLDESGLAQNTMVVYTSDQGFYLGEHGWFDKRFMYEESLRMPLIVRYPEEIHAGVSDQMVMNLDFAPSFLDYAGVPVPKDMQGRSLKSILNRNVASDWREAIYYHYYEYPAEHSVKRHYGIRTKRYKLIHFYFDIDAWELYDLEKDPHELVNLYDNPSYALTVLELREELERLRRQYGDTDEKRYLPR